MVHPDTHFVGVREGRLRASSYRHLRVHGGFVNAANWAFAPPVGRNIEFGLHIYGADREPAFLHLSKLYGAEVLTASIQHDGSGEPPGQKWQGKWDLRPHRSRVVSVDLDLLEGWQKFRGDASSPSGQAALLYPITVHEQRALDALTAYPTRLRDFGFSNSSGFHEKGAKDKGLIKREVAHPSELNDVILQGSHIAIGNPLAKEPNDPYRGGKDWVGIDLTHIEDYFVPRTAYVRACGEAEYERARDVWRGAPYTSYFRLAWRSMIDPKAMERSLYAAIIPPGPAHVHAIHSLAMADEYMTALVAGFWNSIPLDYVLRVVGRTNLAGVESRAMPAPQPEHPLARPLLVRTLRLNCLTRNYSTLWSGLFEDAWKLEGWAAKWSSMNQLNEVRQEWEWNTPLRSERERRAASVEIDSLVAVWLGIGVEELIAVLRSRYPILTDREDKMFFDAAGRRIASDPYAYGHGQQKGAFERLVDYLDAPNSSTPPEGYSAPFYKADRESEYRQAHVVFSQRLQDAIDAGWQPS